MDEKRLMFLYGIIIIARLVQRKHPHSKMRDIENPSDYSRNKPLEISPAETQNNLEHH